MKIFIEGRRDGYSTDQCGNTMTVGQMIAFLEQFDEDDKLYIRNDGGYTYGRISYDSLIEEESEEDYE